MVSKASSTSFVSASKSRLVILHVNLDLLIRNLELLRIFCRKPNVPSLFHLKPLLQDIPKSLQLLPSCHHAEVVSIGTTLRGFRLGCKRMQGTQFRPSWNHPSTLLTTCLPRWTLHLAFRACYGKVWPVCLSVRTLQEDASPHKCVLETSLVAISIAPSV